MKNSLNKYLLALSVLTLMASCKKEPDSPPVGQLAESSIVTIDSLRDWQTSVNGTILIQDSLSVFELCRWMNKMAIFTKTFICKMIALPLMCVSPMRLI